MDLHERSLYMDDTVTKNGNRVVVDNPTIFFFFFCPPICRKLDVLHYIVGKL